MAISTYTELKTAVATWLNRSDLTAVIPDFISLAEDVIQRRVRGDITHDTLTLDAATVALPADCRALRAISLTGTYAGPLYVGTPEQVYEARMPFPNGGVPRAAAVLRAADAWGGTLLLGPEPNAEYEAEITYESALLPLSSTRATNTLLSRAKDIYLFGALAQAAPYLAEDERIPVWQARFDAAIEEWNLAREREEYGASLRPLRLARVFG